MKGGHNGEGWCPPRRVEMATTQRGGACPSSARQKRNENTKGRAPALPIVLKWQQRDEEGHAPPPRRIKKETKHDGEGANPPRREMATTRCCTCQSSQLFF